MNQFPTRPQKQNVGKKDVLGTIVETMWTQPQLADAFLTGKKNWKKNVAAAAAISMNDLQEAIDKKGINPLRKMVQENPVGDPLVAMPANNEVVQFGYTMSGCATATCTTCACGTNMCGTNACGTSTCGTCWCKTPKLEL